MVLNTPPLAVAHARKPWLFNTPLHCTPTRAPALAMLGRAKPFGDIAMDARIVVSLSPRLIPPPRRWSRALLRLHAAYRLAFLAAQFARLLGEARP